MIDIIALQALFGLSIPISKNLLGMTSPIFLMTLRTMLAGFLFLGYSVVRRQSANKFKALFFNSYLQLSIISAYFKYVLRYWALDYMPAVKMAFLCNLGPFIAALFSYFFLHERLTQKQWLGLIIGFLGFIPIMIQSSGSEIIFGEILFVSWPELATIGAVCAHCFTMIFSRSLIKDQGYAPSIVSGIRMLGVGVLALITCFAVPVDMSITDIGNFIPCFFGIFIVSNVICHNLYLHLLKKYSVTFLSLTDFISPFFTALYSWLFLGEYITWHYMASSIIVSIGLYLFYIDEQVFMIYKN